MNGMDQLSAGELDFPPTIVLRFEKHKLIDVSAEFQSLFDHQIAQLRGELDSTQLDDFKNSDGKLSPSPSLSVEQMHHRRLTKIKVLEIVWAYLYSGREQQAWDFLHFQLRRDTTASGPSETFPGPRRSRGLS
jgi:hypothetical protein